MEAITPQIMLLFSVLIYESYIFLFKTQKKKKKKFHLHREKLSKLHNLTIYWSKGYIVIK